MTSKSKAKGTYHENWFVKLFKGWGLAVKRQPLSGALGGEYSGDLVINLNGRDYIAEVKYRKELWPFFLMAALGFLLLDLALRRIRLWGSTELQWDQFFK